jgi:hypothetical protein
MIDSSHAFGDWTPHPRTAGREDCTCAGCGGTVSRGLAAGGTAHDHRLEWACDGPPPEGVVVQGGFWIGGQQEPGMRCAHFTLHYPLRQDDGAVALEAIRFPVSAEGGKVGSTDPFADRVSQPKRGVGGQTFE